MDLIKKTEMVKYCPGCKTINTFHKRSEEDSEIYSCARCGGNFDRGYIISYDSRKRLESFRRGFGYRGR